MSACLRLFVYGTLRRGETNHYLLGNATLLGVHRTNPRYTMLDLGWYPAVIDNGQTAIVGEVYSLSKAQLPGLDMLEDYPNTYTRQLITSAYGSAWMYLYRHAVAAGTPVIPSGDWRRRKHSRFSKRPIRE